jgi:hypothetical protein
MTAMTESLNGSINVDLFCVTWWRRHRFRISRIRGLQLSTDGPVCKPPCLHVE